MLLRPANKMRAISVGLPVNMCYALNEIKANMGDLLYRLSSQKFEEPSDGEEVLKGRFVALNNDLKEAFERLEEDR